MRTYEAIFACLILLAPILNAHSVRSADQEGYKRLTTIEFTGNQGFNAQTLVNVLRFVKTGKSVAQDMVDYDIQVNLRGFLEENGYLQCEVSGQLIPYNPKEAKLEIHVSEGPQYRIHKLNLQGFAPFEKEEIYAKFQLSPGEIANRRRINDAVKRVGEMFRDQGYADWSYIADQDCEPARGTVSLTFTFEAGTQYRVAYVGFVGCNSQAQEDWLRQSISMRSGDIYKNSKLAESRTVLDRTGLFKKIKESDYAIYPVKEGLFGIVFWLTPRK
jgi:outer membrane protein assembly factor BamA